MRAEPAAHIGYIDGLRALAVLGVLCAHIALHAHLSGAIAHIVLEGAHGVDLFFVISGFCLAYPTLRKYRTADARPFDLAAYALKRLVRICPPYYAAIAAFGVAALLAIAAGRTPIVVFPGVLDTIKQMLFIDHHTLLINSSFWTLMVEFRWYFVFPVCLAIWLRSPRAFVALGIAAVAVYVLTRARGVDFGTLPGFMLGIVAADIHAGARLDDATAHRIRRLAPWLIPLAIVAGIVMEPFATIPGLDGADVAFPFQPTILAWQLAMFFVVVACATWSGARTVLNLPPLKAVGIASYSVYLVHEPIVTAMLHKTHGPASFALAFVVPLAAGCAFWAVGEWPFTNGPLRAPLTRALTAPVRAVFSLAGVAVTMPLPSGTAARPLRERDGATAPVRLEPATAARS